MFSALLVHHQGVQRCVTFHILAQWTHSNQQAATITVQKSIYRKSRAGKFTIYTDNTGVLISP